MKLGNSTSTAQSKSTMLIVFRAGSRVLKKLASIALVLLDPKGHRALQVSNKSDKSDKKYLNYHSVNSLPHDFSQATEAEEEGRG